LFISIVAKNKNKTKGTIANGIKKNASSTSKIRLIFLFVLDIKKASFYD